ncbi:MAG: DMT family transporter [Thermoleophilaceae bacterium]|nr:DMT family transporter [Thermoleophilaceae bacterium]
MTLAAGLLLAALSAAVSQVGFLLRHRGAVEAPDVDMRRPLRSAIDLFRSKWWTVGYALAVVAYLLHVGALTLAALSLVQVVLAGGIVLLAVIAERFFGFELGGRQWAGVVLASVGLALLALMGESRSGQDSANYSVAAMVAFEAVLVGAGTALILTYRLERMTSQRGVLLAVAAGLLFTVTHVAVKALSGKADTSIAEIMLSPYLPIAVAGGIAAFFASARSLQLGPAVPVIAVTSIAGNASAIPAGIVVFGDPLGEDAAAVVIRSLAFALVVVAAALIPAPTRAAAATRQRASSGGFQPEAGSAGRVTP